jgi:hypothetical protein
MVDIIKKYQLKWFESNKSLKYSNQFLIAKAMVKILITWWLGKNG